MRTFPAIEIETGYVMPTPKWQDKRTVKRPSKWYGVLTGIAPVTESFKVEWSKLAAIKTAARQIGITIVWADTKETDKVSGLRMARVWRVN